jgi:glycosyltransferase involved in cell wall biosynthesis
MASVAPLHIGFDGQIHRHQRRGGISRYFADLATGLEQDGVRVSLGTDPSRGWAQHQAWRQADVVHATFYGGHPYRLNSGQCLVSSLFDMIPERHPEQFFLPALRSPHANKSTWLSASDLIISISTSSADDLAFFHPDLHTPLRVVHLATAIDRIQPEPVERLVNRRFWLMVGKRHAYKNGLTLMRALVSMHRGCGSGCNIPLLVFAGGGHMRPEEKRHISAHGLDHAVLQLPASDPVLAWLYRHAEAVLVPSLAEGFSLPLIEALVCDTPVVASDLEVHREVGRRFATFLPPLNAECWAEWLISKCLSPQSPPSELMGGLEYAKLCEYYSMARLIAQHISAYQAVL